MPFPSPSPQPVHFDALDGRPLAGSLFEPDGSPHGTLLVSSGTGWYASESGMGWVKLKGFA
jgi:hypothetical protein